MAPRRTARARSRSAPVASADRLPAGMVELRGARVLVTGAGGGLGGYISRAVGGQGANLVVSDLPGSEIEARAEELGRMGVESHVVPADLTDSAERERLVREAEEAIGPLDVLVNNAGLEFAGRVHEDSRARRSRRSSTVNLIAVMDLTLARRCRGCSAAPRPRRQPRLDRGQDARPVFLATYAATKHGVVGFHALAAGRVRGRAGVVLGDLPRVRRRRRDVRARMQHMDTASRPGAAPGPARARRDAVARGDQREDRAEVIVNRGPIRPLAALYCAAPK